MDANHVTEQGSSSPAVSDIGRDVILWKRRTLSLSILAIATATWVLLEIYKFNFVTVASWVSMTIVSLFFIWGNMLRLLSKEHPDVSGLEISEDAATKAANTCREMVEEGVRWMFDVSAEREWFVFAGVVAGLLLLSYVATFFDLLTFLYIGTVTGMTIPVIYIKYEDRIKRSGEWARVQSRKVYEMADEKVIKNLKNKVVAEKKEKKVE